MEKLNILIIEDEVLTATDIKNTLVKAGHHITGIARSEQEAITLFKRQTPDLVLLDIYLEGTKDGVAIVKEILLLQHVPIIVITANTEDITYRRTRKVFTPAAYITKPFKHIDLPRLVDLAWQNFKLSVLSEKAAVLQDSVFLPVEKRYEKVCKSDIVYISTRKGSHAVDLFELFRKQPRHINISLGYLEQYFTSPVFYRISRSLIVNLSHIEYIENTCLKMQGYEMLLPIPEINRAELIRQLAVIRARKN